EMNSRNKRLIGATALICGGIIAAAVFVRLHSDEKARRRAALSDPLPLAGSTFRNTQPGAEFVGMERCQSCHAETHAAYMKTAHSQALGDVHLAAEPPDGEFDDARSLKHYRIHREGETLYHEESIRSAAGNTFVLTNAPMRYVIGSGRFSRSYLVERDGFLFESPATWYTANSTWGLSPGYSENNQGFQRPAELRCLSCHVGRLEPVGGSPQRLKLHARAIDCERCHGPGLLHAERHEQAPAESELATDDTTDDTIVNPLHLDRQRRDDICAQCHLHSAATIELRGRSVGDFRAGLKLSDFVAHYAFKNPRRQVDVVGHAEQMRLSRCYQASETLTCTTCHDPHAAAPAAARYRAQCLECHSDQSCREPRAARLKREPEDNCIACHMPKGPTEIPHFAFTHHRIGIHRPERDDAAHDDGATAEPGELVSLGDESVLPALDRARNLGLAYLQVSDAPGQAIHAETYRSRALEILEKVQADGLVDVEVDAALARLNWNRNSELALELSAAVVAAPRPSPEALATATFTLGSTYYALHQPQDAERWLQRTTELRQTADLWMMLCECYIQNGNFGAGLEAAQNAAELAPDRPRYVQRYASLLAKAGRVEKAQELQKKLPILHEYRAKVDR
ncbi:MAG: hypothetical protein HY290_14890, partial [Planctomycetia bacterium]|nr:hypothetical protein [Planctomycetia bacterium]